MRVARGRVLDVVVDLRRGSPTFGEWEGVELDDEHGHQLYIPVGFGHGFCVLSETADFVYKCTNYYDAATEAGIRFDDPDVGRRVAAPASSCSTPSATARRRRWPRSPTRCRSATNDEPRRPVRAEPDGRRCTSATCAPRCSPGCSPAPPARASSCGWRTSTTGRVQTGSAARAARRPGARSGSTGTARSSSSPRATTPTRPRWSSWSPATSCTSASARAPRSAPPRRRRTGRCRRAPTPARACG